MKLRACLVVGSVFGFAIALSGIPHLASAQQTSPAAPCDTPPCRNGGANTEFDQNPDPEHPKLGDDALKKSGAPKVPKKCLLIKDAKKYEECINYCTTMPGKKEADCEMVKREIANDAGIAASAINDAVKNGVAPRAGTGSGDGGTEDGDAATKRLSSDFAPPIRDESAAESDSQNNQYKKNSQLDSVGDGGFAK